jgi:hypothetical protein
VTVERATPISPASAREDGSNPSIPYTRAKI